MMATTEAQDLTKRFGRVAAVDGLSFTVQPGRVTGFAGPNGAGKSTTIRMILGLDRPTAGTALIGGQPYTSWRRPLHQVGALLDSAAVHPGRSAYHHLQWLAHTNQISKTRVTEVLDLVGLSTVARRRAGSFSLGMTQRLGIAAALLGDPPVLILDEPVNGLDPEGIRWIRGFLRDLAAQGRTVLISSHLMSELEDTADHLIVIGRGRLIADTSVAALLQTASIGRVHVRTPQTSALMALLSDAGATVASTHTGTITVAGMEPAQVAAVAATHHLPIHELSTHRASLEEAYLQLTRDASDHTTSTKG